MKDLFWQTLLPKHLYGRRDCLRFYVISVGQPQWELDGSRGKQGANHPRKPTAGTWRVFLQKRKRLEKKPSIAQRIHVWYIHLHWVDFHGKVVAEYTNRPMDSMGSTSANIRISGSVGFQPLENSGHPCFVNGQIMDVHTWRIISGIVYHTYL